ncbi:hypothetical protein [Cerasicoccus maritimus]|uniref:hypothetical protein n=1 Tax=Cerasicoccus maritimus TaxID=490089 RepID=UPI002852B3CF|nr:hypothetical protein [Cerasicoccus maritimus]
MKVNLAPFKFRDVMVNAGGPVKTVDVGAESIFGREQYSAAAYLKDELRLDCDLPDGVGSANDPTTAKFRAVSEALERWAFRQCKLEEPVTYGFDYDPTTNGMGAYPGLFSKDARQSAEREAIERHVLILWWEGYLECHLLGDPFPGVRAIRIENPFSEHEVVLLWQFLNERFYTYGFGLAANVNEACWRAGVEMHRLSGVIGEHYQKYDNLDLDYINQAKHLFEKRTLFFSRPEGFVNLLKRVESHPEHVYCSKPVTLIDRKVSGPWDQYVTVWRVVFEQPSREFINDRADYFFW